MNAQDEKHVNFVRSELQKVVFKLSAAITASQQKGKIPADYSLGFANGIIFAEHMISRREVAPDFFNRTTSIGTLPIPVALRTPGEVEKEFNGLAEHSRATEEKYYTENVLCQSRGMIEALEALKNWEEKQTANKTPPAQLVKNYSISIVGVRKAIVELDEAMTKQQELIHARNTALQQETTEGQPASVVPTPGMGTPHEADGSVQLHEVAAEREPTGQAQSEDSP